MRDRNDEDFLWTHQVERRKRILIEMNPSRAVLGGGVPLGSRADTLNRATQFLQEAGSGKDAAFFVPRLRSFDLSSRGRMEANAHSAGRGAVGGTSSQGMVWTLPESMSATRRSISALQESSTSGSESASSDSIRRPASVARSCSESSEASRNSPVTSLAMPHFTPLFNRAV